MFQSSVTSDKDGGESPETKQYAVSFRKPTRYLRSQADLRMKTGHEFSRAWAAIVVSLCFAICSGTAFASGPWDGTWYIDAQHSSRHSVLQLTLASDGVWTIFDGDVVFKAAADGQVHRQGSSANEIRAFQPDPRKLVVARGIHGREYDQKALTLSADGKTLTSQERRLGADGRERHTVVTYVRLSASNGLQGEWTPVSVAPNAEPASAQSGISKPAPRPAWVIWTGADGTMTWFIPNTGETLRGKADTKLREIQGPYNDGTFFSWKQTSPTRLEFTAYVDGKPEEYAVEMLSEDSQTFTDTLWAPGHEDSKTISVFHKQP